MCGVRGLGGVWCVCVVRVWCGGCHTVWEVLFDVVEPGTIICCTQQGTVHAWNWQLQLQQQQQQQQQWRQPMFSNQTATSSVIMDSRPMSVNSIDVMHGMLLNTNNNNNISNYNGEEDEEATSSSSIISNRLGAQNCGAVIAAVDNQAILMKNMLPGWGWGSSQ